jgi:hypothetical protein
MPWQLSYLPADSVQTLPSPLMREFTAIQVEAVPYPTPPPLPREWFSGEIAELDSIALPEYVPSIFQEATSEPLNPEMIPNLPSFPFGAVSGILLLFALVIWGLHRATEASGIKDYVRGIWSMVAFRRWLETREPGFYPAYPALYIAGQIGFCGFLLSMPWLQSAPWNSVEFLLLLGVGCIFLPLLKAGLNIGISKIYGFPEVGILHVQILYQFHWLMFLGSIPLTILQLQFPEWNLYTLRLAGIGLGLSLSIYFLRILVLYFRYVGHSLFYLILYLCTLELLPAIWIVMRTGITG